MASEAAGSYWGAQGSQGSQGSSQGSGQYDDGMYRAGNSGNAGTAGTAGTGSTGETAGTAGTSGAGTGTGAGTSGATAGTAGTGGTRGTSGSSGSQYGEAASQLNGQTGWGQEASSNQASGSQTQGTGQSSGQWSNGASSGTGSASGNTQGQTNGQSQWNGQGQTSQGQTGQGQSQANTQPAAQNSNWNANSNSNALNFGSQSSSQQSSGYNDGTWHGNNEQPTNTNTNALNQDSTDSSKSEQAKIDDGQWHPELWSETAMDPTSTSKPTNSPSSTQSDLPTTETPGLPSPGPHRLSPGAEAGIAVGVMSLVLLLLGLIFFRLHRKKRALQMAVRNERNLPPVEKQNPMYNLASNLYTKSSLTLVGMSDTFKGRGNNSDGSLTHPQEDPVHNHDHNPGRQSIHNGPAAANESTSTVNSVTTQLPPPVLFSGEVHPALRKPTWKERTQRLLSPVTATASFAVNKMKGTSHKELSPAQRRSLQAHEYGFSEEFLHIPPPPESTRRLPRVLSKVQENGSLTVRAVTQKFNRSQSSLARSQSQSPQGESQAQSQPEQPHVHMQPPPPAQLQHHCHCKCSAKDSVQQQEECQPQSHAQPQVQPQLQTQAPAQAPAQPQPQPEKANNGLSTWTTMNSIRSVSEYSDEHQERQTRFPSPSEMIGEELFRVRSVSSGMVAMNNPAANISVDALTGRISGEDEQQPDRSKSSKSVKFTKPKSEPESQQQPQPHPQSPPQSKSPSPSLPSPPSPVYQSGQPEVPSVKPWSVHLYRVDMPFAARSTGHLDVGEGTMVRLDQAFDDGWVSFSPSTFMKQH